MYVSALLAPLLAVAGGAKVGIETQLLAYLADFPWTALLVMVLLVGLATQTATIVYLYRHRAHDPEESGASCDIPPRDPWRETADTLELVLLRLRPDGTILSLNRYGQELFGYQESELVGRRVVGTIVPNMDSHGADLSLMWDGLLADVAAHRHNENENMRRDGSRLWMRWTNHPMRNASGTVEAILCMGEDASVRKRLEMDGRRLSMAADLCADGLAMFDLEGRCLYLNRAWAHIHGYRTPKDVDRPHFTAFHSPEQMIEDVIPFNRTVLDEGRRRSDVRHTRRDGSSFVCEQNATLLRDENGAPSGYLVYAREVTGQRHLQEELRRVTAWLQALADGTDDLCAICDRLGRTVFYNAAYARAVRETIGVEMQPGMRPHELLPDPEARAAWERAQQRVLGGESFREVTELRFPDGRNGRWEMQFSPLLVEGEAQGFVQTSRDVAELETLRAAVAEGRNQLDLILENVQDIIFSVTTEGELSYVSEAAFRILGWRPRELTGRQISALVHPSDLAAGQAFLTRAWGGGQESLELRCRHAGEGSRWLCITAAPVRDADGRLTCLVGSAKDVTVRRAMELELRESRERFEQLATALDNTVFWLRSGDRVLYVSPGYAKVYGRSVESLLADGDSWLELVHPEDLARVSARALSEEYRRTGTFEERYRIRRPDGEVRWIHARSLPVLQSGRPTRMAGIAVDITESCEMTLRLEESIRRAETAAEAKNRFLATMSHEIRTPANGVLGMLQLLAMQGLEEPAGGWVEAATTSARKLADLLADLIDLARMDAGQIRLDAAPFLVRDLLSGVSATFAGPARDKGLTLTADVDEAVPPLLRSDVRHLRQLLHHLVDNAVKFTDRGSVQVRISRLGPPQPAPRPGEEPPLRLLLAVHDTGPGIPEDRLEAMFNDFALGDDSYTRRHRGAGLGLAMVRQLVSLLGGSVVAESAVGEGTSVYVTLPLRAVCEETAWTASDDGEAQDRKPPCWKRPVLVVGEDESLGAELESAGIPVRRAAGNEAALVALDGPETEDAPCGLLLDGRRDVAEDVALLRAVRNAAPRRTPVLCVTTPERSRDWGELFEAGLSGLVPGDVPPEELARALRQALA